MYFIDVPCIWEIGSKWKADIPISQSILSGKSTSNITDCLLKKADDKLDPNITNHSPRMQQNEMAIIMVSGLISLLYKGCSCSNPFETSDEYICAQDVNILCGVGYGLKQ